MNKDITWCTSPDCKEKCKYHISNYVSKNPSPVRKKEMVSIADFSGVCREYIRQVLDEVKDG